MNGILWLQIHAINLHLPCIVLVLMRRLPVLHAILLHHDNHTLYLTPLNHLKEFLHLERKYLNFVGLKNVLVIVSTDEKCCSIKINQSKSIGIYLVRNVITYMCSFIFDEFSHFNCKFKVKNLCENSLTRKCVPVFKMKHN